MFSVGFGEVILVLIVALIVIKPEDIPRVSELLGLKVRMLRRYFAGAYQSWREFLEMTDDSVN